MLSNKRCVSFFVVVKQSSVLIFVLVQRNSWFSYQASLGVAVSLSVLLNGNAGVSNRFCAFVGTRTDRSTKLNQEDFTTIYFSSVAFMSALIIFLSFNPCSCLLVTNEWLLSTLCCSLAYSYLSKNRHPHYQTHTHILWSIEWEVRTTKAMLQKSTEIDKS